MRSENHNIIYGERNILKEGEREREREREKDCCSVD
jgi:hypothetical protein